MKYKKFRETRREIIILDEWVEVRWNHKHMRYYTDLGYEYTSRGDAFMVHINDLPHGSRALVNVECPVCGKIRRQKYQDINKTGHTLDHGCANTLELSGKRFGRLVAIDLDYNKIDDRTAWWICQCDCGNEISVTRNALVTRSTRSCGCYNRDILRGKCGENHYNWNPEIPDEVRLVKRRYIEYKRWAQAVLKRDKYTCQVCGDDKGGNLNAHHLYSYSDYPDKQLDLNNGTTVCDSCHDEFHYKFMGGSSVPCTPNDFEEWLYLR